MPGTKSTPVKKKTAAERLGELRREKVGLEKDVQTLLEGNKLLEQKIASQDEAIKRHKQTVDDVQNYRRQDAEKYAEARVILDRLREDFNKRGDELAKAINERDRFDELLTLYDSLHSSLDRLLVSKIYSQTGKVIEPGDVDLELPGYPDARYFLYLLHELRRVAGTRELTE